MNKAINESDIQEYCDNQAHEAYQEYLADKSIKDNNPFVTHANLKASALSNTNASTNHGVNPKDRAGNKKPNISLIPPSALILIAKAMELGAAKYGPYNWREKDKPIQLTPYIAAISRHQLALLDGENLDPESGLPHWAHIASTACVVMDALVCSEVIDDRPPKGKAAELLKKYTKHD